MALPNSIKCQDEISQLNYIQNSDLFLRQKPYEILSEVPDGCEKSNFRLRTGHAETIHDIRGYEDQFDLDNHGFQVMRHTLEMTEFDEDTIKREYIPAIETLLKGTGTDTEVYVFDWRLRSSALPVPQPGSVIDLNDPSLVLKPVQAVHVGENNKISQLNDFISDNFTIRSEPTWCNEASKKYSWQ
ncbi:unnamed protein product [Clonostachys chloroleuca]|uniref:Uncharacterized protein n=1 Tax=Clonostachys chloroleuca TaxID=1926264 RepID=A0AA35M083_9HYPO|nr:unnamed protein product [Clonostachys chloroleuca]